MHVGICSYFSSKSYQLLCKGAWLLNAGRNCIVISWLEQADYGDDANVSP